MRPAGIAGDQVEIELTDSATLTEDARARLFDSSASEDADSRGLQAVQAIVQRAGGRIAVESAPRQRHDNRVQLPVAVNS